MGSKHGDKPGLKFVELCFKMGTWRHVCVCVVPSPFFFSDGNEWNHGKGLTGDTKLEMIKKLGNAFWLNNDLWSGVEFESICKSRRLIADSYC